MRLRSKGKVDQRAFRISSSKNRVADPADAPFDLSVEQMTRASKLETERNIKGDGKFCRVRERPLLILHLLTLGEKRNDEAELVDPVDPVVTLSVCLPETKLAPLERTYQVNRVFREAQLSAALEEADDDEDLLADG